MNDAAQITTIALITGDRDVLRADARQLLMAIRWFHARDANAAQNPILVIVDGADWDREFSDEDRLASNTRWVVLPEACELPGVLVNDAVNEIDTPFFSILPIGAEVSTWDANKSALLAAAIKSAAPVVAGHRGVGESRVHASESFLTHPDDGFAAHYQHAWLQMLDLVPMANAVLRRDWFREQGGFSSVPALQRTFWWEYTLRVTRIAPLTLVPLQPVPIISWHRYPFALQHAWPFDASARLIMQSHAPPHSMRPTSEDEVADFSQFVRLRKMGRGLMPSISKRVRQSFALFESGDRPPLRVTVLGDIDSAAHNQLGFFGFFELLRLDGVITWRAQLDSIAQPIDLIDADLVIFTRVTSTAGLALMRWCHDAHVPTIYGIDDNWFWQGREWKGFEDVFAPGKPKYENFLSAIGLADAVFAYNQILLEDLEQRVTQTVLLPTCIDIDTFPRIPHDAHGNRKIVIGFVGSQRRETAPLEALAKVAMSRDDVIVFIMSHEIPEVLRDLPSEKLHFEPYQHNYAAYAATVCAAQPSVLLAPAGNSRFEASKCPNKYLEITAAGATGLYSHVDPYRDEVIDGKTGLLVGEGVDDWTRAITRLVDDHDFCTQLGSNAMDDVRRRFSSLAVLPEFLDAILSVTALKRSLAPRPKRIGVIVDARTWKKVAPAVAVFAGSVDPVALSVVVMYVDDPVPSAPPLIALATPMADLLNPIGCADLCARVHLDVAVNAVENCDAIFTALQAQGVAVERWPTYSAREGAADQYAEQRQVDAWLATVAVRACGTSVPTAERTD